MLLLCFLLCKNHELYVRMVILQNIQEIKFDSPRQTFLRLRKIVLQKFA